MIRRALEANRFAIVTSVACHLYNGMSTQNHLSEQELCLDGQLKPSTLSKTKTQLSKKRQSNSVGTESLHVYLPEAGGIKGPRFDSAEVWTFLP